MLTLHTVLCGLQALVIERSTVRGMAPVSQSQSAVPSPSLKGSLDHGKQLQQGALLDTCPAQEHPGVGFRPEGWGGGLYIPGLQYVPFPSMQVHNVSALCDVLQ